VTLLFATARYDYLRDELQSQTGDALGALDRRMFDDGEHYHRVTESVVGERVVLIGGTIDETETLELFDLACGLVAAGARSLTMVAPYFGYATMDRAVKAGEVVKAKTRARLLSAIPRASEANRLLILDLHAEGIQHYFEGDLLADHVYAKPVILDAVRELGRHEFVVASADAGRAKWVESLANELGASASFVFKRRKDNGDPVVTALNADVAGRSVVIYDDMIRSGQSLLNAADAYRSAGAKEIAAVATHGLFAGDSLDRIRRSGLISRIICTNSHPRTAELADGSAGFLHIRSIAGVLADAIMRNRGATP
jgi:ribose-phosphate pyrophosphokinase